MPQFLNIGSGRKGTGRVPPWFASWKEVRLDIDPQTNADIIGSVVDMKAVGDESFDGVWAENIIEHLSYHEVQPALKEIHRVLKPDGHAEILVPNLQMVARLIVADKLEETAYESDAGPITALDMLFGHRAAIALGKSYMAHKTGFTPSTIEKAVLAAGFTAWRGFIHEFDILVFAAKRSLIETTVPA